MTTASETLDKASAIIQAELTKRFEGDPAVHKVSAQTMLAGDDEFIHCVVIFEGSPQEIDPRMLNAFDLEIEPLLAKIGIYSSPAISYQYRNELGQWETPRSHCLKTDCKE